MQNGHDHSNGHNGQFAETPWWGKMVVYWLENQIAITFYSELPPTTPRQQLIDSLNLDGLSKFLNMMGYKLTSFTKNDICQSPLRQDARHITESDELNSQLGKYVFRHPSGHGSLIKCFFNLEAAGGYEIMGMPVLQGMGMMMGGGSMYGGAMSHANNITVSTVNLINKNREALKHEAGISILGASPNWLSGGTPLWGGCGTHGCPQSPPIPVKEEFSTWHIDLPGLSPTMQSRTGEGVTVFVLDTRPQLQQIKKAAQAAGANNTLLQTVAAQLKSEGEPPTSQGPTVTLSDPDCVLPDVIEQLTDKMPTTGRDICGRLVGYDVTDHGLFVAGMIRDIAPAANIECVRVLNNFGVGTIGVLVDALEEIHHRMSPINPETGEPGDLYQKPVVINMSLVTMVHQEEMVPWWTMGASSSDVLATAESDLLTHSLHSIIQTLTDLGAVIVGAAGNDSDERRCIPPDKPKKMIVCSNRMKPRFPAAFPEVISVGAVDKEGFAAEYSNDPVGNGSLYQNGVVTYGGGIPYPIFPQDDGTCTHPHNEGDPFDEDCMTSVDTSRLDALVGLYSATNYPALSIDDEQRTYAAPNANGWAYWSGTSFAAPIISAVAARLLEELTTNDKSKNWPPHLWHSEVMRAFTRASGQMEWLTNGDPLPLQAEFSRDAGANIGVVEARQQASGQGSASASEEAEVVA